VVEDPYKPHALGGIPVGRAPVLRSYDMRVQETEVVSKLTLYFVPSQPNFAHIRRLYFKKSIL
jgi:hypothetical protein